MRVLFFLLALFPLWAADHIAIDPDAPTIVLDPGHGGVDHGARAHAPYCEEKKLTLLTSRLVRQYLMQLGYHVVMTRDGDATISLPHRVEVANKRDVNLYVSIHYNSTRNPKAHGIEVFFCDSKESPTRTKASRRLADSVLTRLVRRTQASSRGVKKANFYVLRETEMPAILVEAGFISNPDERKSIRKREYMEKIARGIADGIDHYLKKHKS